MQETPLLILDEPTSGLDGRDLDKVVQCLKKQADAGKAIPIITHDHELVQKACSKMLHLAEGTLRSNFPLRQDSYEPALMAASE